MSIADASPASACWQEGQEVFEDKEIFEVDVDSLHKVIDECYCKNVSKKEHEKLQEEIQSLFGFYSYVKDKSRIKPFVVINKKP